MPVFLALSLLLSIISTLPHLHVLLFSLTLCFSFVRGFDSQGKRKTTGQDVAKGKRRRDAVMSALLHFEPGFSSEWNASVFSVPQRTSVHAHRQSLAVVAWHLLPASLL